MNFAFTQYGYIGILNYYGVLSSEKERELTEALMVSLDNTDYLVVNLQNVKVPNCASLKPVWSAQLIARRQNKSLMLIGVEQDALRCDVNHYKHSGSKETGGISGENYEFNNS